MVRVVVERSHFISYSPADAHDFVVRLREELERGRPPITVWHDKRDLRPGEEWDSQIDRAIRASETLIFVMTKDSVSDDSVCKPEWSRALKYRKPIVPLLLHRDADMPFRLDSRQYIDFADFDQAIVKLRQHLLWVKSPEGVAHVLSQSLGDARRALLRAQNDQERERLTKEIQELERQIESYDALGGSQKSEAAIAAESRRLGARVEAIIPPRERPKAARRRGRRQRRTSPRIFLNYRRDDSTPYAARLHDALSDRFGSDSVFQDLDVMRPGTDWKQAITSAVASSDVVLVLIGQRWQSPSPDTGKRRIDASHDFVRLEIEAALASDTYLIPILVEGARMPSHAELPGAVRDLADRNALALSDARWSHDIERLMAALEKVVRE